MVCAFPSSSVDNHRWREPWTCSLNKSKFKQIWLVSRYQRLYIGVSTSINVLKSSLLFLCSQFLNKRYEQLKPAQSWLETERLKPILGFTNSGLLCHPIRSEFPAQQTAGLHPPSSSSFPDSTTGMTTTLQLSDTLLY